MASKKKSAKKTAALRLVPPPKTEKLRQLDFDSELVDVDSLKPHPRNYKTHPEEQLRHIGASLKQHGYYKNVVVAKDGTLLAGHGVWEAAKLIGQKQIPVRRLRISSSSPEALKIIALDNELGRFAETDDRVLADMLKEIREKDVSGLLGTGYDDSMLAALLINTRPAAEIKSINEAGEWIGMPDYEPGETPIKLVITFTSEKNRKDFVDAQRMKIDKIAGLTWSTRWPWTEREDASSIRFENGAPPDLPKRRKKRAAAEAS